MTKNYPFSEIQEKLANSEKIIIALPQNPFYDQIAGALALSLALQQSGKETSVVCPSAMTVGFNNLVGVDKIAQKIKGTDLVVSLGYSMDNIEKISYNDDGGKLNLVLQPKSGAPPINEKAVNFSYAGSGSFLIFSIGVKNISQLNSANFGLVNPENIVNIDNRSDNTNFSQINVIDTDSSSLSEMVLGLIEGLNLSIDVDTVQNIINGLWQATSGLKNQNLQADTYEAVAFCLRMGAQKPTETQPPKNEKNFSPKQPKNWPQQVVSKEVKEEPKNPPADWFEPKIYKGSSNV